MIYNMYPEGISDSEFRKEIIDYLLGKDWYVADPISQNQINAIALYEIQLKYKKNDKLKKAFKAFFDELRS